jgi:hypothetical protein
MSDTKRNKTPKALRSWMDVLTKARNSNAESFVYENKKGEKYRYVSQMAKNGKLRLYKKSKRLK